MNINRLPQSVNIIIAIFISVFIIYTLRTFSSIYIKHPLSPFSSISLLLFDFILRHRSSHPCIFIIFFYSPFRAIGFRFLDAQMRTRICESSPTLQGSNNRCRSSRCFEQLSPLVRNLVVSHIVSDFRVHGYQPRICIKNPESSTPDSI